MKRVRNRIREDADLHPEFGVAMEEALRIKLSDANLISLRKKNKSSMEPNKSRANTQSDSNNSSQNAIISTITAPIINESNSNMHRVNRTNDNSLSTVPLNNTDQSIPTYKTSDFSVDINQKGVSRLRQKLDDVKVATSKLNDVLEPSEAINSATLITTTEKPINRMGKDLEFKSNFLDKFSASVEIHSKFKGRKPPDIEHCNIPPPPLSVEKDKEDKIETTLNLPDTDIAVTTTNDLVTVSAAEIGHLQGSHAINANEDEVDNSSDDSNDEDEKEKSYFKSKSLRAFNLKTKVDNIVNCSSGKTASVIGNSVSSELVEVDAHPSQMLTVVNDVGEQIIAIGENLQLSGEYSNSSAIENSMSLYQDMKIKDSKVIRRNLDDDDEEDEEEHIATFEDKENDEDDDDDEQDNLMQIKTLREHAKVLVGLGAENLFLFLLIAIFLHSNVIDDISGAELLYERALELVLFSSTSV